MASELTVEAVRMALDMSKLRAEVTSWNIVNASVAGAPLFVVDSTAADAALQAAAGGDPTTARRVFSGAIAQGPTVVNERYDVERPSLDELVADSVVAGLDYQVLAESLGRHFGLMRLAISGRSGA